MSINIFRKAFFIFIANLLTFHLNAQVLHKSLDQFLNSATLSAYSLKFEKEVRRFYLLNGYGFAWLNGNDGNISLLAGFIKQADALGLEQEDYQPGLIKVYKKGLFINVSEQDSFIAEVKFTDAAIHFLHDVLMGNKQQKLSYNGLLYTPECYDIALMLFTKMENGLSPSFITEIEPTYPEYLSVKQMLNNFMKIINEPGFTDVLVGSPQVNGKNTALLWRLYQLGIIDSDTLKSAVIIKEKVKEAQKLFNLLNDGVLRSTTLKEFNMPLISRVNSLKYTLNTIRWLSCIRKSENIIVVNIPSATLLLYGGSETIFESSVIVGKKLTPTPTLCSNITEVILYPYWHVPFKIATRELLPRIKRNVGYLDENNFQVLNLKGNVVDARSVNWSVLNSSYFPYLIRQSTGCDNSLGLIKLNFYNPFSVYLHDTPNKLLFSLNRRYFSHGCMRVEKAMELGRYILRDNRIAIDTLTQMGCLVNMEPVTVPASQALPVFVLYQTAWVDSLHRVSFFEDVYSKFSE